MTRQNKRQVHMRLGSAMQRLIRVAGKPEKLIVGLISGTSMDGVDAALVHVQGHGRKTKIKLQAFTTIPYPAELRERLLDVAQPGHGSTDLLCRLNAAVGEWFAHAAKEVTAIAGVKLSKVDLIGSHGQTVHHLPAAEPIAGVSSRGTLQIGEPSIIAQRTSVITVADFRQADMALGGQGAPLVPYFDFLMLSSKTKTRGVLNIGGIANLTVLKKNCKPQEVIAFDTGPGNMVIDGLMQRWFGKDHDEGGRLALQGKVDQSFLEELLRHSFFQKPAPKSTGREEFGREYVERILARAERDQIRKEDMIATVSMLTVESIHRAACSLIELYGEIDELIVSGGGAHNQFIMKSLQERFAPAVVTTSDVHGISGDAKEAICFAVLANETISGFAGTLPSVTGASAPAMLGKICF